MKAKYLCEQHGVIEREVRVDATGQPPQDYYCDVHFCGEACGFDMCCCDSRAQLVSEEGEASAEVQHLDR